jgi:hypothetical protein
MVRDLRDEKPAVEAVKECWMGRKKLAGIIGINSYIFLIALAGWC